MQGEREGGREGGRRGVLFANKGNVVRSCFAVKDVGEEEGKEEVLKKALTVYRMEKKDEVKGYN